VLKPALGNTSGATCKFPLTLGQWQGDSTRKGILLNMRTFSVMRFSSRLLYRFIHHIRCHRECVGSI